MSISASGTTRSATTGRIPSTRSRTGRATRSGRAGGGLRRHRRPVEPYDYEADLTPSRTQRSRPAPARPEPAAEVSDFARGIPPPRDVAPEPGPRAAEPRRGRGRPATE